MNNLHLSEEAQNDLAEIKAYIEEELLNPSAALAMVSKIIKSLVLAGTICVFCSWIFLLTFKYFVQLLGGGYGTSFVPNKATIEVSRG